MPGYRDGVTPKARLRRALLRVPGAMPAAKLAVETIRVCLRYRVTGLASEAGFFMLLSLPPLVLGLFGGVGYIGGWLGNDIVAELIKGIQDFASRFLVANVIGIIPYTFTVTSHIIITAALALLVFLTVLIYGFYKNGLRFFKLFVPSGIPIAILPLVVVIEIISFLSRPISHSVRLFANMLAGHITLKVFASFITMLGAMGIVGVFGAVLPLALVVALTALELLVAFLQAYVFTILTCIYINDAIHPGH